jgi:hypothetical protein
MVISQQIAGEYEPFLVVPDKESASSRLAAHGHAVCATGSQPGKIVLRTNDHSTDIICGAVLVRGLGFGTLTNGIALVFKFTYVVSVLMPKGYHPNVAAPGGQIFCG